MNEGTKTFRTFEEFWPYYLAQHSRRANRRWHVAGTGLALTCLGLSPWNPWLLLAAPVIGYGCAWWGHYRIEKNRPATFDHPWWSLRGDGRMFLRSCLRRPLP